MMKIVALMSAAAMFVAQPCLAAQDYRETGASERRSGVFVGLNVRIPMGQGNPESPSARMQLTTTHEDRNGAGAVVGADRPAGLELGLTRTGSTSLHIAGQDLRRTRERLALNGSTTTYLIIGGVVLAVIVLASVASALPTPGPREGAFD